MGKKHFSEEQIAFALRQAESGTSVYAISVEKRLKNPAVVAISQSVRKTLSQDSCRAAIETASGSRRPSTSTRT